MACAKYYLKSSESKPLLQEITLVLYMNENIAELGCDCTLMLVINIVKIDVLNKNYLDNVNSDFFCLQ